MTQTFYGSYADFGNITVGDVTLSAGESGDAYY